MVVVDLVKMMELIMLLLSRVVKMKIVSFSFVGIVVMIAGIVLLNILVQFVHIEPNLAYFFEGVFSVEINFVLNKVLTWRSRKGSVLLQWIKFNASKIGVFIFNQILFFLLVHFNINYLIAFCLCVVITTVVNYVINDILVFEKEKIGTIPRKKRATSS